jgi:sulfate transport system ATP-binding protein
MRHEREQDFWAKTQEHGLKEGPALPTPLHLPPASVTVSGVYKRFARFPALDGVSLEIAPGELLALLGPSGSGKTTLLRLIAGLETPDAGVIAFDGSDVTAVRAAARGVGFVFQQYALFKHMTVARNIAFGLDVKPRRERPSRAARQAEVERLLDLVRLPGLGGRYPAQLSGGQRQRVALARALAVSPRILLLDEPFGALDAQVRKTLRRELRRIHEATGLTTVFVTHDQDEALELADRVAILNGGRIEQIGAPSEIVDRPASAFVAGFVGHANRLEGEVQAGAFRTAGVTLPAPEVRDGPALAFAPPEQIGLAEGEEGFEASILRAVPQGLTVTLECVTKDGRPLDVSLLADEADRIGDPGGVIRLQVRGGKVFAA